MEPARPPPARGAASRAAAAAGWGAGINPGGGGPGLGAGEVGESQNDPPKLEAFLTPPIEPVLAPKHK